MSKYLVWVCDGFPTAHTQGDQKVSVHLMITVQKTSTNILNSFNHLPSQRSSN
jgi:hypothetical protein